MDTAIDDFAEEILSKNIQKQEALRRFAGLTEPQKQLIVGRLRSRLAAPGGARSPAHENHALKVVTEQNLTARHREFIGALTRRYGDFVPRSKQNALRHMAQLVDARKVSNLKRSIKALQFHLTYERAEGPYLYDIDGHRYIDVTGDHGVNIFGSRPGFIRTAIEARADKGFPLLGYTEEAFEAARLFCELTGNERVAFTQSGTEAVALAVRIARAARKRMKIVIFEGAFHGMSDTVAAIKDHQGTSLPAGLGIPQAYADQLLVLDYGDRRHLRIIEDRCDEIAGVLLEPVQSSRPQLQPAEFLRELRAMTLEKRIPLIFDEMITGFRVCPRGAQGHFGVKADLATYGKIPGGGLPTGMVAGSAEYMDFIDGGTWKFDDDSMPSRQRVYIGGTHTRNPLKLSAVLAVLTEIKARCSGKLECASCTCFQKELNETTRLMAERLDAIFASAKVPLRVDHFSSLFKIRFLDDPYGLTRELFFVLMRMNGIETSFSGNFFLNTAHAPEHIDAIIEAVRSSIHTLVREGFFQPADGDDGEAAAHSAAQAPTGNRWETLRRTVKADLLKFQARGN